MLRIEYRHPTKADVKTIADVLNRSNADFPMQRQVNAEDFRIHVFRDTDYDPQGHWLAIIDNEAVGYGGGDIHKSHIEAGLNNGWVGVEVVPEYRNKGIEQQLMQFSLEYLISRKICAAQQQCMGTKGWRHDLAREVGFKDVRHGYLMMWKKDNEPRCYQPPDNIHLEHRIVQEATHKELTTFVETYNDAFSEHYNFSPMTVERLIISKNKSRIARITFAKDGSKTIGLCAYGVRLSRKKEDATAGMVGVLGVISLYRRRGIGRAMISHAMKWLSEEGMATICLSVDTENPHALNLYTSLGFAVVREDIIYRKELLCCENQAHECLE